MHSCLRVCCRRRPRRSHVCHRLIPTCFVLLVILQEQCLLRSETSVYCIPEGNNLDDGAPVRDTQSRASSEKLVSRVGFNGRAKCREYHSSPRENNFQICTIQDAPPRRCRQHPVSQHVGDSVNDDATPRRTSRALLARISSAVVTIHDFNAINAHALNLILRFRCSPSTADNEPNGNPQTEYQTRPCVHRIRLYASRIHRVRTSLSSIMPRLTTDVNASLNTDKVNLVEVRFDESSATAIPGDTVHAGLVSQSLESKSLEVTYVHVLPDESIVRCAILHDACNMRIRPVHLCRLHQTASNHFVAACFPLFSDFMLMNCIMSCSVSKGVYILRWFHITPRYMRSRMHVSQGTRSGVVVRSFDSGVRDTLVEAWRPWYVDLVNIAEEDGPSMTGDVTSDSSPNIVNFTRNIQLTNWTLQLCTQTNVPEIPTTGTSSTNNAT